MRGCSAAAIGAEQFGDRGSGAAIDAEQFGDRGSGAAIDAEQFGNGGSGAAMDADYQKQLTDIILTLPNKDWSIIFFNQIIVGENLFCITPKIVF